MLEKELCRESKRPVILRDWLRYKAGFRRAHPDYFDPDGLAIFVGGQGTGKTLSAVNYVYKLLDTYPHAKLVTNVALADYPIVAFFEWFVNQDKTDFIKDGKFEMSEEVFAEYEQRYLAENRVFEFCDNDDFKRYSNGECGVIFFVDEIQLYMNSLESKNINIEVITQISQQRKQRKHIVATSQVFGRMAKPLREQFSSVMLCKNYMGCIQVNALLDRDSLESDDSTGTNISGEVKEKFVWFHSPSMYARYDTSRVVERGKFVGAEKQIQDKEGDKWIIKA